VADAPPTRTRDATDSAMAAAERARERARVGRERSQQEQAPRERDPQRAEPPPPPTARRMRGAPASQRLRVFAAEAESLLRALARDESVADWGWLERETTTRATELGLVDAYSADDLRLLGIADFKTRLHGWLRGVRAAWRVHTEYDRITTPERKGDPS